jgi:hypothetical protein
VRLLLASRTAHPLTRFSHPRAGGSPFVPPLPGARFFILKSFNHQNIASSIENGVWATQRHNEALLTAAFAAAPEVVLVFSVNASGHFQGYARMATAVGRARGRWTDAQHIGHCFGVQWEALYDLPFSQTSRLSNPLNEGKPVKISRDGQELPHDVGVALVNMLEAGASASVAMRPQRRPPIEWEAEPAPVSIPVSTQPQPQPGGGRRERSRSRERDRRKKKHRSRSGSRERGRRGGAPKGIEDMSYEEYLAQMNGGQAAPAAMPAMAGWGGGGPPGRPPGGVMEFWAGRLRQMGWDGRGGEAGMEAFWRASQGWQLPPQRPGGWGAAGGRGRGYGPPRW